ncbi:MAG TPA: right-handed parallel beta-helix repeat-containing protein [Blastocatellia bacterium]|nr:right-handed parallel beta-helix repeat-containing protein [Blastocatellia bacterium]
MQEKLHNTRAWTTRWLTVTILAATFVAGTTVWTATFVSANHPVLVEGEADFDGDGRLGLAEDTDGDDRIFGTITAALAGANGGANQNGRVTIVTSGRFHEQLIISNANGNTTIEAAPGVEATIDAVGTGTRAAQFPNSTNAVRQGQPGIIVNSPANRYVTLRNLVVRNWSEGLLILSNSRVTVDNLRLEGNADFGMHVTGSSRVLIAKSTVSSTGFRVGAAGDIPGGSRPTPGSGIVFEGSARGLVSETTVSGNFRYGLAAFQDAFVEARDVVAFDNDDNFFRIFRR